jgi:uncharacterized GH25 family protein
MKRISALLVMVIVAAAATACGGGEPAGSNQNTAAAPAAAGQNVDITFKSEPDPPKTGENTFEVMVMSGGQPVTDADVAVEFYMPAMPQMKMAEMRNTVPLKHDANGRYTGTGNVMMAGNWDTTVMVKRGGQELGSSKLTVIAK